MIKKSVVYDAVNKKYYNPKTKNWETDIPKNIHTTNKISSISKSLLFQTKLNKSQNTKKYKNIPVDNLQILQIEYDIVEKNRKALDFKKVLSYRTQFEMFQKSLGNRLVDLIADTYKKNEIENYKYIVRLKNPEEANNHQTNNIFSNYQNFIYNYVSTKHLNEILKKIKSYHITRKNFKIRCPLILVQTDEDLTILKLCCPEYIHHIENLNNVVNYWKKSNLID